MPLSEAEALELKELERKASGAPVPAGTEAAPLETLQEEHPDISFGTRLLLKNLSKSPESSAAYIKQNYPGMDVEVEGDQIKMKRPEEKQWRVLDPQTGPISSDLPKDILDVGYDTLAGLGIGAASALGGTVGNIPGAMVTGGATGAGAEALRQKLGQIMGIPQDVSGKDVATQGVINAVLPGVFGTSASKSAVAQGVKKFGPAIGEALSGVPKEALDFYAKQPERIAQLAKGGLTEYAQSIHEHIRSGLARAKQALGKELQSNVELSQTPVNISKAKQRFDDLIISLEDKPGKNKQDLEVIKGLKQKRDDIFGMENPNYEDELRRYEMLKNDPEKTFALEEPKQFIETPDEISASHAFSTIQDRLKEAAEYSPKTSLLPRGSTEDVISRRVQNAADQAYKDINKGLDLATEGMSSQTKEAYKRASVIQRHLSPKFSDFEKTYQTLSNANSGDKRILKEQLDTVKKITGGEVDLLPVVDEFSAVKYMTDPSWMPYSGSGTTSTSRTVGAGGLGGLIGLGAAKMTGQSPYLGVLAGGSAGAIAGGPKALKAYINLGRKIGEKTPAKLKGSEPYQLLQQYLKNKSEEEQ